MVISKKKIIKRKRRFVCDLCEDGYFKKEDKCYRCSEEDSRCESCEMENNKFKCNICNKGYYLNKDDNRCEICRLNKFLTSGNKCVECSDIKNGGIEGCKYCETNDENENVCRLCKDGYILLSNNNTCLNISKNKELDSFNQCNQVTLDNNNKYTCSRCKDEYKTVLKGKCVYIPEVNYYFDQQYLSNLNPNLFYRNGTNISNLYNYYFYDNIYRGAFSCQEAINLGTEDKPIYSCIKCYNMFEYDYFYV